MTNNDIKRLARDIISQCKEEYSGEALDETVADMAAAVIFVDGLSPNDARRLRAALGL
jgi:hypothetical protein